MNAAWALFRFHCLQIWRSRLLVFWFLLSLFVQFFWVKILHSATVQYDQSSTTLGSREIALALLYIQFFTGGLLATVYGVWVVPYLHEESRAPLFFALPVRKVAYPLVYAVSFAGLYLLQLLLFFFVLVAQFGGAVLTDSGFPWTQVASDTLLSLVALETLFFWLAVVSLYFGKVAAFLGGSVLVLVLQVSAALFRSGFAEESWWKTVYAFLPPLGEMVFDLKQGLIWRSPTSLHFALWTAWAVGLALVLRLRLKRA